MIQLLILLILLVILLGAIFMPEGLDKDDYKW